MLSFPRRRESSISAMGGSASGTIFFWIPDQVGNDSQPPHMEGIIPAVYLRFTAHWVCV